MKDALKAVIEATINLQNALKYAGMKNGAIAIVVDEGAFGADRFKLQTALKASPTFAEAMPTHSRSGEQLHPQIVAEVCGIKIVTSQVLTTAWRHDLKPKMHPLGQVFQLR